MNKAVRELAKSASRALGALYGKFVSCGGMTYSVFIKLYQSTVEPILFYGSRIWGTKQHSVINNVQNKAGKPFLAVGKRTSNLTVRDDLGLMTCFNKQKLSCIRLISRLKRTECDRLITTVSHWASRRRKGWHETVSEFINSIECADVTVKTVMRLIKDKMTEQDNDEFPIELFNGRNQPNGNKLRTYRLYKENVNAEQFVLSNIPCSVRQTMALFKTGALPLAVETGRYSRPQVHLNDRLCKLCDNSVVDDEQHFMMNCPLYSDIRFELIQNSKRLIVNFDCLSMEQKFISILKCNEIQPLLAHTLHTFF
jgi:hypothetical protein